jgi:alkanesulfonate monooxygenase SsuD/methylene tetrahydromethanopterin reductase-like flavin-dependent oxidoreductase (luciferase family)
MTARLFAQVDEVSGGRVIAGVGAGWTRAEFEMFGLDFPEIGERLAIMDEAMTVMRGLWTGEPLTHTGKYFRTESAVLKPLPTQKPGPPIMLGGSGNGILRRAGRWADILHMAPAIGREGTTTIPTVAAFTDETIAGKLALVRAEAEKAGRPRDAVRYATTIYNYAPTTSPAQTREVAEHVGGIFQLSPDAFLRHPVVLAGTPDEMVAEIRRRIDAHGLSMMGVNFSNADQLRAFADDVIAKL